MGVHLLFYRWGGYSRQKPVQPFARNLVIGYRFIFVRDSMASTFSECKTWLDSTWRIQESCYLHILKFMSMTRDSVVFWEHYKNALKYQIHLHHWLKFNIWPKMVSNVFSFYVHTYNWYLTFIFVYASSTWDEYHSIELINI